MDNSYRRLCAAILNQAADDCKRKQLDAVLFLLTEAERYCDELDFDYQQVFDKARKWYTKIMLSEAGPTVSSSFLMYAGIEVQGVRKVKGKVVDTIKGKNVKKVLPWFHAEIKKAIEKRT